MSGYTYTESSRRYYTEAPKIIQSRGSSSDSRSSYESRGSTDQRQYTSSRTSMGYNGGSQSKVVEEPKERRYRDPNSDQKYVKSVSRGGVEIIQQQRRRCDPEEPRSSDATSSQYNQTRHGSHSSSRHSSSHEHSSHRR